MRAEYEEKFAARDVEPSRSLAFLNLLEKIGHTVEVAHVDRVVEADPDDDMVLACAVIGSATHLVTYDPHFLPLGEEYEAIRIVNGLHFLYLVRGDTPPQA